MTIQAFRGFVESVTRVFGLERGLTKRVHTEARLLEAEQRYRSLVERLPAVTYVAEPGPRGVWRFVSPQIETLVGYSPEEWRADPGLWLERLHPDDRERATALDSSRPLEYRMRTRDGREIWVRDEAILDTDHDGTLVLEGLISDITARRRAEERLYWQAEHDQLTGLHNRAHFELQLATWLAGLADPGRSAAVILLDIDDFKLLNDSLGHVAGDEVIRGVAAALAERSRGEHPLARFSGDEFAVLVRDVDDARALATAEELLASVRSQAMRLPITASAGVAVFSGGEIVAGDVLVAADIALHQAKDAGRDRAELFTGERGERLTGVERVRAAIDEQRLVLDSQPIVDLATGDRVQEELLVRMRDERGEIVPPSSFLPAAERFGLIRDIDRWVVRQGIRVAATGRRVEINLSARSIGDMELTEVVEHELTATGADPADVILEITETTAVASMDAARSFAERLVALGCGFALDDFGTGFGSFIYLKHLPLDYLKLDIEFIRELSRSQRDQRIVSAIVGVAQSLELKTIAEGVEDADTLALLGAMGIDMAQGYFIGRPQPLNGG